MSVGILLVTHSGIGGALLNVVAGTFGHFPLRVIPLSVTRFPEPANLILEASKLLDKLDSGDGVLILTDILGSTPSNIAHELPPAGFQTKVVAGLNLPMLFRIFNYPHLPLEQLAQKALSGGKEGIVASTEPLRTSQVEALHA